MGSASSAARRAEGEGIASKSLQSSAHRAAAAAAAVRAASSTAAVLDGPRPAAHAAAVITEATLHLIHFNDVYNIETREQEPCGGVAKFVTKVREIQQTKNALVLFSGDAFNPSLMSTITKGEQMPPCLNRIGVHCAAVGNHDLDFGPQRMRELIKACSFPWLMANVRSRETGELFEPCKRYHILQWEGIKVGIMGLVEYEWLSTLATLDVDDLDYVDFVDAGRELAAELRALGCRVVIALTHMRVPNDVLLGQEVPEIDIILGGHDHHYEVTPCAPDGPLMFKSGTDFREFSLIEMRVGGSGRPVVTHERVKITSDIRDDPETAVVVAHYHKLVGDQMENVVGFTAVPLDGRFNIIRTQESNIGNLVVDILRFNTGADVCLVNSGTIRSDSIHDAGALKVKDLVAMLPMVDDTCVLEMTGERLLQALENGVSMYPKLEGRFLQVSGLTFEFDRNKSSGARIDASSVMVGGQPLDLQRAYSVATKEFLVHGKDGFSMFPQCKVIRTSEHSPVLTTMLRHHFDTLRALSAAQAAGDAPSERASGSLNRLAALAVEAARSDASAIIRWSDEHQQFVVDPCTEQRIVCRG